MNYVCEKSAVIMYHIIIYFENMYAVDCVYMPMLGERFISVFETY